MRRQHRKKNAAVVGLHHSGWTERHRQNRAVTCLMSNMTQLERNTMYTPTIPQKHPDFLQSASQHLSRSVDLAHYVAAHHLDQALLALADADYHLGLHLDAQRDLRRLEPQLLTGVVT